MTSRERLLAQLRGDPLDRIPVYAQVPFALDASGMKPSPFHGYADYDRWREEDRRYREIVHRMESERDNPFVWRPSCMQNLQFVASTTEIVEAALIADLMAQTQTRIYEVLPSLISASRADDRWHTISKEI